MPLFLCREELGSREGWFASSTGETEEARRKAAGRFAVPVQRVVVVRQEEDVLDTWFSSALVPFANFGWPEKVMMTRPLKKVQDKARFL